MSRRQVGKMIAESVNDFDLGERVRWFLMQAYPGGSQIKRIARDFNVSSGTAKRWLAGICPTPEHLNAMARRWGLDFFQFVSQPLRGQCFDLEAEMQSLRDEMRMLREEMRGGDAA